MEAAVAAIRTCKTQTALDDMLGRFELTDSREIVECLNRCMYDPERYFSANKVTIEEDLALTRQIFLTGTWRLNEFYDRMGISLRNEVESAHA